MQTTPVAGSVLMSHGAEATGKETRPEVAFHLVNAG